MWRYIENNKNDILMEINIAAFGQIAQSKARIVRSMNLSSVLRLQVPWGFEIIRRG